MRSSVFIILLLCTFVANAQTFTLKGKVQHLGNGLSQGLVVLNDSLQKITDRQGNFTFKNLQKGKYKLLITHADYNPILREVHLVSDSTLAPIELDESRYELQEVVVNDRRQEQIRRQFALQTELASTDYLRKNRAGTLMQSLEKIPGVSAMQIGSGQSKPQIRGLGFNQVAVVEGGIKHEGQQWGADHGLEIDQFAVGQAEIIKGPSSFLYGSEAIGGVIRLLPSPPPALHSLNVQYQGGFMSNSAAFTNSLSFSARQHKWYADVRATFKDYGDYKVPTERLFIYDYEVLLPSGYVRNTAGNDRNIHISLGRITEKVHQRWTLSNVLSASGFFANAHGLEPRRVNSALHDASHRDVQLPKQKVNHFKALYHATVQMGKQEWEVNAGFQHNYRTEHSPYVNHGFMPHTAPEAGDLEREYDKKVVSAQVLDKITWDKNSFQAGINYEYQHNSIGGWGFLIPGFTQHQGGAFAFHEYSPQAKRKLQAALRYDLASIAIDHYADWFPSAGENYLIRVQESKRSMNSLNFSLGWRDERDYWQYSINAGSSFRVPLAKELAANGVNYHYFRFEKGNANLDPEKSYQLDVGLGGADQLFQWELSPFINYFPNYIYLNPTAEHDYLYGAGNQVFQYEQSKVLRYGGEMRLRYHFHKKWETVLSGDYLYSTQLSGSKKGFTLPFAPPPTARIEITYTPWEKTYFRADVRHSLAQNRIVPPEKVTPAFTLLGLAAGTEIGLGKHRLELQMQVNNLLNTRYLSHTSFYRLIALPEMGRNVTLSLRLPLSFAI
jgi:iron complex outermembrane receptor protein